MKAYKLSDGHGNFVGSYSKRFIWHRLSWLKRNPRYEGCTIIEYDLMPTGRILKVEDYQSGSNFESGVIVEISNDGKKVHSVCSNES